MLNLVEEIIGTMRHDVERMAHQTKRNSILVAVAALFGVTAYVAGISAAGIYAARFYGEIAVLMVIFLAAIFGALAVLVALRVLEIRDQRAARAASNRVQMVTTIGTALIPALFRSKALGLTAASGGVAYLVSNLLSTGSRAPRRTRRPGNTKPLASQALTNGAINPYATYSSEESLR